MLNKKCKKSALGGTFSFLHIGHKFFLKEALKISEELIIGISSDEFVRKLDKKHPIEPYEVRALKVLNFCLKEIKTEQKITIFPLDDPYGPTIWDSELDCIIVSEETYARALEINSIRINRGLRPLNIIKVKLLTDEKGKKISSTLMWKRYGSIFTDKIKRNFS